MHITTHKEALEAEQKKLFTELTNLGVQNLANPTDWIATPEEPISAEADENIVADRSEEWLERHSQIEALEIRYNNVLRALRKIADNTYGSCEVCQNDIEPQRLNANPAARTCIAHINESLTNT